MVSLRMLLTSAARQWGSRETRRHGLREGKGGKGGKAKGGESGKGAKQQERRWETP
jgi:hypothetical protein